MIKMSNKTMDDWVTDAQNYAHGLFLVPIKNNRIPVSNQVCPLCSKGWNAKYGKFAVKDNKVFHDLCLIKFGMMDKEVDCE